MYGQPIEEVYDGVKDGDVLGEGISGLVRRAKHKITQVEYAVKILELGKINSTEGLAQLRNEIFIMCQLDHPNIARIEEVYESPKEIYIVQELCLGGDLFDRLDEEQDWHFTEPQCARLVKQMLSAVRYLHSKGIIHRDLKLENFLFSSKEANSELRMIDFGLSKHFTAGQQLYEQVGTPYTVAPEIIEGHHDEKCDIWALGVITYLLLSGEAPFGGIEGEDLFLVRQNIQRNRLLFEPAEIWDSVSSDAIAFVKRLLKSNPVRRPTAKEAQKDFWIQVWAKKDAKAATKIHPKVLEALMTFKEQSEMQKLLSEVLSFTLLPEQIVEQRAAFQKMDTEGTGEISLHAMKKVLLQNAEAGALGGLTEQQIESLFEAIRVRKSDPTIHWHEFLAACLSQAKIDDRNLRLAFDRMDTQRKSYITLQDLKDMLGKISDADKLEKVWLDSLNELHMSDDQEEDRIYYDDFKSLMKGQPTQKRDGSSDELGLSLRIPRNTSLHQVVARAPHRIKSKSYQGGSRTMWEEDPAATNTHNNKPSLHQEGSGGLFQLPEESRAELETMSPLDANRTWCRFHREIRQAVLEASKEFDEKRKALQPESVLQQQQAGLTMKRGAQPMVGLHNGQDESKEDFALPSMVLDASVTTTATTTKGYRRPRGTRNKTVSDVTGLFS